MTLQSLQPFERLLPVYLDRLMQLKKRWLVSQPYYRAIVPLSDEKRIHLLLTDYDDPGLAKKHFNAVKTEPMAAVIDLENGLHKKKLEQMLQAGSGYCVFWSVVKSHRELKAKVNRQYADHIRRFIQKTTDWKIGGDKTIRPVMEITFGELFIILNYPGQPLRVKFEEIEKA